MARVAPQAGAAGPAAVGRVGAEARQLTVGQGLAGDAAQPRSATASSQPCRLAASGLAATARNGRRTAAISSGLELEEQQELDLVAVPVLAQIAVAAVLVLAAHAAQQEQRQPQQPNRRRRRPAATRGQRRRRPRARPARARRRPGRRPTARRRCRRCGGALPPPADQHHQRGQRPRSAAAMQPACSWRVTPRHAGEWPVRSSAVRRHASTAAWPAPSTRPAAAAPATCGG